MKNQSSIRSFGIVFFIVFLLVGLWPLLNNNEIRIWALIISLIFLILGLIKSKILVPLNNAWIKFGELLGRIIAPIVMAIVYFIVLTPMSFLVRILGKDLLKIKFSNQLKSYWIKREKNVGSMKNQF
tara:strand:+ start:31 stop:411 length:381 start_codon:yes stop_codon:yes gene_type:complete